MRQKSRECALVSRFVCNIWYLDETWPEAFARMHACKEVRVLLEEKEEEAEAEGGSGTVSLAGCLHRDGDYATCRVYYDTTLARVSIRRFGATTE